MRPHALAVTVALGSLLLAAGAPAATLTLTPARETYAVGDEIVLHVLGDAEGAAGSIIFGRILYDAGLAEFVRSEQEPLTSFGGAFTWFTSLLDHGPGFADAFSQLCCDSGYMVDGPLMATVVLRATAPGELAYEWETTDLPFNLRFFDLFDAPGGSVTVVPEPATALLVAFGLVALGAGRGRRSHGRSTRPVAHGGDRCG